MTRDGPVDEDHKHADRHVESAANDVDSDKVLSGILTPGVMRKSPEHHSRTNGGVETDPESREHASAVASTMYISFSVGVPQACVHSQLCCHVAAYRRDLADSLRCRMSSAIWLIRYVSVRP